MIKDLNQATSLNIFAYNGNNITFNTEKGVMVNATEMAKPFGKRPSKWLELPSTKEFLEALQTVRKSDSLIQAIEGKHGGTWFNEDVAIEYARWLSPMFSIWCNDCVKELLTQGYEARMSRLAVMSESINGVAPMVYEGEPLYCYPDLVASYGVKRSSGVGRRKLRTPRHFKKLFGRNFVTAAYAKSLQMYYGYKQSSLFLAEESM